jgi:hypothetical protein
MTLLKTPFAAVRTRRLRAAAAIDNHLRRDIGLPEMLPPVGLDLAALFFSRMHK